MGLMRLLFAKTIDRRIAEYQKELIAKHCDEVQNIYQTMRGWRHDYHNHIQTLLALSGNEAKTREYLLKLNDDLTQVDTVLKTGNVMVDAILNSKLSLIRSKEIRVNAKAVVPTELNVSEIDLCVIIGNLLDNAMEACLRQTEEKERFTFPFPIRSKAASKNPIKRIFPARAAKPTASGWQASTESPQNMTATSTAKTRRGCSPPRSCCRFEPIGAKYHTVRAGNPHYDSAIW